MYHIHLLKTYSNDNPISPFHLYVPLNYPQPFRFTDQNSMLIYNILNLSKYLIHLTSTYAIAIRCGVLKGKLIPLQAQCGPEGG